MADGSFEVLSVDSARAHSLSPQPCSSTSLSILSSDLDKTAQLTSSFIEESDADETVMFNSKTLRTSCDNRNSSVNSMRIARNARPSKNRKAITQFIDTLSSNEESDLNNALAEFIFGCNIPFAVIESSHFKNFVNKLRPAYAKRLPCRKSLSTTLLDKAYDKSITESKKCLNSESVIVIDGWKNTSSNSKTVVSMIHNSNGHQAFLNAWDLFGESETGEKVSSVELAKKYYNTTVYAVVSDNASVMIKMGNMLKHTIWHTTCNSHTANLLAKNVINKTCTEKIINILKEFKHVDIEKKIIEKGGHRIKLPCETRWCSYRDAYLSLINNLQYMKVVAAESDTKGKKTKSTTLLYDEDFLKEVKESIEIFNPICKLINTCQSATCSLADAVDQWLNLEAELPQRYQSYLKTRMKMALNDYALAAFYLHPCYENNRLPKEHKSRINKFLLINLNADGIEDLDNYNCNEWIFKTLNEKGVVKPLVF
jgi:hypothetical protein